MMALILLVAIAIIVILILNFKLLEIGTDNWKIGKRLPDVLIKTWKSMGLKVGQNGVVLGSIEYLWHPGFNHHSISIDTIVDVGNCVKDHRIGDNVVLNIKNKLESTQNKEFLILGFYIKNSSQIKTYDI